MPGFVKVKVRVAVYWMSFPPVPHAMKLGSREASDAFAETVCSTPVSLLYQFTVALYPMTTVIEFGTYVLSLGPAAAPGRIVTFAL